MTASLTPAAAIAPAPPKAGVWFIVEGALLATLGILAGALPVFAGLATALVFGWVLILAGVLGFASLIASRGHAHPAWRIVSALLALVAGGLVLREPIAGVLSLALLIAAYLMLDAIASLGRAFDHRRHAAGWGWLIFYGVAGLVLAGFIVFLRPRADAALIGFIIALDFIVGGVALVGLGLALRGAPSSVR